MKRTVSRDIPLAEITLRKYEKPFDLEGRELVKKLCLSLGLLQPGDSRDVVVDVLQVILESKEPVESEIVEKKVIDNREKHNLQMLGIASSNVRRQIRRLRERFLVEKVANTYRITENAKLSDIFTEKMEQFYVRAIVERVKEYCSAVDVMRKK